MHGLQIRASCELLSFTQPIIYKLINSGETKSSRVNVEVRIQHKEYINYINNRSYYLNFQLLQFSPSS